MPEESEEIGTDHEPTSKSSSHGAGKSDEEGSVEESDVDEDQVDDTEELEDEPKLKYARLTSSLLPVFRNGDATSAFLVAGDKMFIGTHNGNVSLVEIKDVQLRNFARPVQCIALSPDYKNDRAYISGGLAGNLVLTVGGRAGTSTTSTTTGTAAATASGWLGSMGLGAGAGKDTVLHSGEGSISTIKWSLSGKYVVWVNEHGVKIMRSSLFLEAADLEYAWKRIGHVDRPDDDGWEEMAGVWKARVEWIDEKKLESDEDDKAREAASVSPATAKLKQQSSKGSRRIEKLLVGWGGTVWMINIHPGGVGVGKNVGERSAGRAEIIKILRLDCIISGLSLYTPTLLIVLAYVVPDKDEEGESKPTPKKHKSRGSTASTGSEPRGGIRHRQNALSPELRLIDLGSSVELDTDTLTVSRFERLSASDYHLSVLPAARGISPTQTSRGTLETLSGMGVGMWNATITAGGLLGSSGSVRSAGSKDDSDSPKKSQSLASSAKLQAANSARPVHPDLTSAGMKIFIHSPYDCILATRRDLSDHLSWLLEHSKYQVAWELVNEHPDVISSSPEKLASIGPGELDRMQSTDDFFDDASSNADSASRLINSAVEKEKRRIGELWIQQLIAAKDWVSAGQVCGKVLGTSTQWKEAVYTFVAAEKFDEIVNYIPTTHLQPPLPSEIYEVMLGHYIARDRLRLRELMDHWSPDLFDTKTVATVLENQLKYRDVRKDSVEGGEVGRDWRIVLESLGKLHLAGGRFREALNCYIELQDADAAMALIKEHHLVDAIANDIPSLVLLRVTKEQARSASTEELRETTSEAIELLVHEAQSGIVRPQVVVQQLEEKNMPLYLFFYLSSLWRGDGIQEKQGEIRDRLVAESRSLVDELADLAVRLFAQYDRALLMEFLKSSTFYTFEKATNECKEKDYVPELVYLYSKTGQTKRALYLIIDRLADVSQAIAFAREQGDSDLWDDLLTYSMDKPRFIRGLLEEVGTAIDPVKLVRRIPARLEIEGLREGLSRMIKEYEIQHSISSGVAKVLRGEVATAQNTLRSGQRKGVKFDVLRKRPDHVDFKPVDVPTATSKETATETARSFAADAKTKQKNIKPRAAGHCIGCEQPFAEPESETLVGFACGHVFHLSHLLQYTNPSGPSTPPDVELDEMGEFAVRSSVGAKVTHARLLKDRIRDGCPVCTSLSAVV